MRIPVIVVLALFAVPAVFATHQTPFNGSFSGSFTLTSQTSATITGTGHMGHLGKVAFAAMSTVTGTAPCDHGFTATEQDTFTAANGDKLYATAHEVACPTSQNTFTLSGPMTITGGTGRFQHASGAGSVDIIGVMTSANTGTFTATSTGTIIY
jgi:hypothetical protein